jgi:hypothetical protein
MNDKDLEAFECWQKEIIQELKFNNAIGDNKHKGSLEFAWQAACNYKRDEYSNLMDAMTQTSQYNYKLQAENKKLREALSNWILWEDEQIKRNGAYVGFDLNCLINQAREALKEI